MECQQRKECKAIKFWNISRDWRCETVIPEFISVHLIFSDSFQTQQIFQRSSNSLRMVHIRKRSHPHPTNFHPMPGPAGSDVTSIGRPTSRTWKGCTCIIRLMDQNPAPLRLAPFFYFFFKSQFFWNFSGTPIGEDVFLHQQYLCWTLRLL